MVDPGRLLMLYYECHRLNGLGSPFGIETFVLDDMVRNSPFLAKWPGKPVREQEIM